MYTASNTVLTVYSTALYTVSNTVLHCTQQQDSTAQCSVYSTVSVLGRDKGYTVKYSPLPEVVPEGKA